MMSRIAKNVRTNRMYFVYVLNIISCFAVVLLHTTLPVYSPQHTGVWVKMVGLQSVAIFAVPVFFMISGMNLLGYRQRESTLKFLKKRFFKVGRALVLASLFCYIIFCTFPNYFYNAGQYAETRGLTDFFIRFLTNQINDVYWFLYSIIYLYILTPILSLVVKNRRCVEYMLVFCGLISVGLPLLRRLGVPSEYMNTLFAWPLFSSTSLLYFLAGYYLHVYWKPLKHQKVIAGIAYLLSTGGMFVLGLWSNGYKKPDGLSATYDSYYVGTSSPLCVVQAFAIFLLLQSCESHLQQCNDIISRVLQKVASASLGVYLFHILLINWAGVNIDPEIMQNVSGHPFLYAVIVYGLTLICVLVGKSVIAKFSSTRMRIEKQ